MNIPTLTHRPTDRKCSKHRLHMNKLIILVFIYSVFCNDHYSSHPRFSAKLMKKNPSFSVMALQQVPLGVNPIHASPIFHVWRYGLSLNPFLNTMLLPSQIRVKLCPEGGGTPGGSKLQTGTRRRASNIRLKLSSSMERRYMMLIRLNGRWPFFPPTRDKAPSGLGSPICPVSQRRRPWYDRYPPGERCLLALNTCGTPETGAIN